MSVVCLFVYGQQSTADQKPSPNIVFILADDLGWRDLGCYGSEFGETPNLDRLAESGMRFTDAYAPAPICSASRAAILTGRSPARLHFEFVTKAKGVQPPARMLTPPPYTRDLPLGETTIAEALSASGYQTGFFGKWHVNEHYLRYLGWSPTHGPREQGFEYAVETFGSHPYNTGLKSAPESYAEGEFPSDAVTEEAVRFLETHRSEPFLLYLSHFYVHTPVEAPTDWLKEKYANKIDATTTLGKRRVEYGSFVETLDHYVGTILDALDKLELSDRTLVVFTSDNGGHPEYASNSPLRGSKWNLYEGGIRVPMIARWPGRIAAGSVCTVPVTGTDLFPTFCDIAGVPQPESMLDGRSLRPLFRGETAFAAQRSLFWHFPYYHPEKGYESALPEIGINDFTVSQTKPQSVVRLGDWKLIRFYERNYVELYNLRQDPGEQHDLAETESEQRQSMEKLLNSWIESTQARLPKRRDATE